MSALDETFGAADEELADAEEVHVHSIALERMQHHLRTRMCSREQRLSHADASALGVDFARHRRGLIEWMCDGTDRLALHRSTFHTASNLLDRTFTQTALAREGRLNLVSAACVRIAAKHCEAESAVPHLSAFVAECGSRYTEWDIAQMEISVLTQLDWKVHCETAYDFVGALGLSSLIRTGDHIGGMAVGPENGGSQYSAEVELLIRRYAEFFVDLAVYEYPHGSQPASLTAAAAVAAARMLFSITPTWPPLLQRDAGYALAQLNETLCHLLDIFMTDFSEDWQRLQEMAVGIVPFAHAPKYGDDVDMGRQETVPSPTSIADLVGLSRTQSC